MFDNMIVSDAKGAESKGRSRYFIVSSAIVGILFLTAVVLSIYAVDIGLGNDEFELSMMLAPVMPDAPEPPKPEQPRNQPQPQQADTAIRNQNMLRLDEQPVVVPKNVSVVQNTSLARPIGKFLIGDGPETNVGSRVPDGIGRGGNQSITPGSGSEISEPVATGDNRIPPPPPVIKPKPPTMVSKGVINGKATYLPHPPYPPTAKMVGAQGAVSVQVTIDESGKVISAKAVDGHPLLKPAAEKAAWSAKFSPTKLSDVPVKVTGMIVYNFKRS